MSKISPIASPFLFTVFLGHTKFNKKGIEGTHVYKNDISL